MTVALVREVSSSIARCELTHLEREPIDLERARAQHRAYVSCLEDLGCRVVELPEERDFPDAVFVEDVALVFDELAVITRPGARSRRGERESIIRALEPYRALTHIREPGVLDGGDVLRVGNTLYVGMSTRSNRSGADQLAQAVGRHGYSVVEVEFRECLHLKSAASAVAEGVVLLNPNWVDAGVFDAERFVPVYPSEPAAGNALWVGDVVLAPAEAPETLARLEAQGITVRSVPASELAKAEGGLTCCSLLFEDSAS